MRGIAMLLTMGLVTIYIPNITAQWIRTYNGPGNGNDYGNAVVLDSTGNVHIAGTVANTTATGDDIVTRKYDNNGNLLWSKIHSATGSDSGYWITLDSTGNVYVAGSTTIAGGYSDAVLLKYDPDGNLLWSATYNGPGNWHDEAYVAAVDSTGNVFIAGYASTPTPANTVDTLVAKYGSDGTLQWAKTFNGPANGHDELYALTIDSTGNVYVAGYITGTAKDIVIIKYDNDGNKLWDKTISGAGGGDDIAYWLAVDNAGNAYLTGVVYTTTSDIIVAKYNPNGTLLWQKTYNGLANDEDWGNFLIVDASWDIFVTGSVYVGSTADYDCITLKYDTDGNLLWQRYYNSANGYDEGYALVSDGSGGAYVLMRSYRGVQPNLDIVLARYDVNGTLVGARAYGGSGDDIPGDNLVIDPAGNLYFTGSYADVNYNIIVVKALSIAPSPTPRGKKGCLGAISVANLQSCLLLIICLASFVVFRILAGLYKTCK